MKFANSGMAALMLFGVSAMASTVRPLSDVEVNAVNWLVRCPAELAEGLKEGGHIGGGSYAEDRPGSTMTFDFYKRKGFIGREYATSLVVSRIRIQNPPADHPGYRVECKLEKKTQ